MKIRYGLLTDVELLIFQITNRKKDKKTAHNKR